MVLACLRKASNYSINCGIKQPLLLTRLWSVDDAQKHCTLPTQPNLTLYMLKLVELVGDIIIKYNAYTTTSAMRTRDTNKIISIWCYVVDDGFISSSS